jgi:hypothetical protein
MFPSCLWHCGESAVSFQSLGSCLLSGVWCSYSMPIGLTKGDKTMRNFASIAKMRNIVCGVRLGQPLRNVQDIEDIRCVLSI